MNLDAVTIEDAIENYYRKGMAIILSSGEVQGFEKDTGRQDDISGASRNSNEKRVERLQPDSQGIFNTAVSQLYTALRGHIVGR